MGEFRLSTVVAVIALASLGAGLAAALRSTFASDRNPQPDHPVRSAPVIRPRKTKAIGR